MTGILQLRAPSNFQRRQSGSKHKQSAVQGSNRDGEDVSLTNRSSVTALPYSLVTMIAAEFKKG